MTSFIHGMGGDMVYFVVECPDLDVNLYLCRLGERGA